MSTKNRKFLAILAVTLSALFACKKTPGCGPDMPSKDLIPNAIGSTWHYLVKDTLIDISDSTATQYQVDVAIVDSTVLPGGIKATVWQFRYPSRTDTNFAYLAGDTLKFLPKNDANYFCPGQYIIPFAIGSSWPYITLTFSKVSVVGQTDITVNSLDFKNAWEIKGVSGMPDGLFSVDEWFENNVGFVRMYRNTWGELIAIRHNLDWTLMSYELD